MSEPTEEWSMREALRALVEDEDTDFTDAVLVLPAHRAVTHDSGSALTAVGVVEWCKASLLADYDDGENEAMAEGQALN